jgi:preprotein translocase subunit SecA
MGQNNNNNNKSDLVNSRALFVLKIITMSFAILACVVIATVMLTRWITDLNRKVKETNTKMSRAAARLNKFRKDRIKHILKQRRLQLKEERAERKRKRLPEYTADDCCDFDEDEDEDGDEDDINDITDEEAAINDFDNELSDIMLDDIDE